MKTHLISEIDYTINEDGNLVFTSAYLLKRGHCCQSGCANCPYEYKDKADPMVPAEFCDSWNDDLNDYMDTEEEDR